MIEVWCHGYEHFYLTRSHNKGLYFSRFFKYYFLDNCYSQKADKMQFNLIYPDRGAGVAQLVEHQAQVPFPCMTQV